MSASKQTFYDYQLQQFNYDSSEWADLYYQQQVEAEYKNYLAGEALAPVVQMFTDTLPATPAALSPLTEQLVKNQDAIACTISELNMLLLNAATPQLRTQVKAIATGLVNKSGMMDSTKENYLQMLDAAEANAAFYYGTRATDSKKVVDSSNSPVYPYKRKYDNAGDIARHLATASNLKEVASLYYVNAELIELTPTLKQAFTDRKARLYRPSAAAA